MKLTEERKNKHLSQLIAFSFFASVVATIISWCFPPDFTVDPPKMNEIGLMLGHLQTSLVILGCTALGIQLTEEKQTISSIGFTMMAITQGVIFVLYVVAPEPSKENLDEVYKLFAASLFLLIPSMLLIAFYSEFPRWLNLLGVFAIIPWITENFLYFYTHNLSPVVGAADFVGQLMMNTTIFFWGYFSLKKYKKRKLNVNAETEA
ncbi:MAG TPA: hypothetical protein PKK99_11445 [Bacteroidia bacterium]|nr:hypothetical protein [Bacteroidia bacterium]HNP99663.1 hypothetical protein [Bacteroidia bacterium]